MSSKTQIMGQLENLIGDFVAEYSEINNAPIIKADLNSITPTNGTYYQHTGQTGTYKKGAIYYYNGTAYKIIDGSGSGSSGSYYDDTAIKNEIATLKKSKQDTLIEGDGITIDNNRISANLTVNSSDYNGQAVVANDTLILNDENDAYNDTEIRNLIGNKVDKVNGKGLSTNDFTTELKTKLENISISVNNGTLKITL